MIQVIKNKIEKNLISFLDEAEKDYNVHQINPILYKSIREFILRRGKRIRPLLFVLSYKGYCSPKKKIPSSLYKASTCMELLHNFMLIHDDIIDRSNLRRGKPTMHRLLKKALPAKDQEKLGYDLGIVAGDIVYALAIDAFLSIQENHARKEKAFKYFVQTAAFTAMGEFIDTLHGVDRLKNIKEKDVFLNYSLKTARYTFDCPLVIGAILAGASESEIKKLSQIGLWIGQAFQIQDDVIGIFDSQKNIGKSILSDLAESKKTLLVCHAFQHARGKQKKSFMQCFNKSSTTYRDLLQIRKILIATGSLNYCLKETESRVDKTLKILKSLKMKKYHRHLIENAIFPVFRHSKRIAQENNIPLQLIR